MIYKDVEWISIYLKLCLQNIPYPPLYKEGFGVFNLYFGEESHFDGGLRFLGYSTILVGTSIIFERFLEQFEGISILYLLQSG